MRLEVRFDGAGAATPLRAARIDRDLAHPVGMAEIVLPAGVAAPAPGARAVLSLVEEDTRVRVMTGHVARSSAGGAGAVVTVLEPLAALLRPMPAERFAQTTGGAVIEALLSRHGVEVAGLLPGHAVPSVVLGPQGTVLDHAMRMARLGGMALACGTDGRVSTVALGLAVPRGAVAADRAALRQERVDSAADRGTLRAIGAGALGARGPLAATLPLADPGPMAEGPEEACATRRAAGLRTLADVGNYRRAVAARRAAAGGAMALTTPLPEDLSPGDVRLLPDARGAPVRPMRVERVGLTLTAAGGLLARYSFSDAVAA